MSHPREVALQELFATELNPHTAGGELSGRAKRIVMGVREHQDALDASISEVSEHWHLERMAPVDRIVLRIGLYELRYEQETPVAVVLDEAVELAKRYSTERSGAFVNGVLGSLAALERPGELVPGDERNPPG